MRALHAGTSAAMRELGTSREPTAPILGAGHAGRASRAGLAVGIVCLLLIALGAPGALPSAWAPYYRVGSAGVLLAVGAWLVVRGRRRPATRGLRARGIEWMLRLAGRIMLVAAAVELALGLRDLL